MKKSIFIITLLLLALTTGIAQAQAPEGKEYIFQSDDWLIKIAEEEYGDGQMYLAIVAATNAKAAEDSSFAVIKNPNIILDGQKLWLPADISAVEGSIAGAGQFFNLEKITCPEFVSTSPLFAAEVAGETYECGVVEVPENYAAPSGRTIELVYLRLFSPAETPAADPLLYLSGGPGGSALREAASHDTLKSNLQFVREKRDLIFYDQRGTGLTAPLNCGPVQAAIGAAIEILPERAEEIRAIESDTEKIESDTTKAQIFNNAVCARGYATAGVDLAQYNSIASAKDMASLMSALGYEQYNLYGTSYGTKLAQVALRETPDRIRQAVLDGTSPVSQPQMANSFIEFNEQYVRLFAQCAADPACNEAYPNLPDRFTALLNRLKDNPIVLEDPIVPVGLMALLVDKPVETIDLSFFNTLINVNNAVSNHEWGDQLSIAGQIPRTILALEEGDLEYVRGVFVMPDIGAAPVNEIQTFSGEISILPDNEYIAPTIDTLLAEAQKVPAVASASTPEQQWVALVINHLVARLQSGDKQTDVISDMIDLTLLPTQGRVPQLLIDYANEFLPEDLAAQANALVAAMTPADVRATMWHLNEVAEAMRFNPEVQPGLHEAVTWAVNCAEDLSLRPADVVDEVIAAAVYPQLALGDKKAYGFFELGCSFFPKTIVPPSFIEPVVSDIPTLFFQGDLDAATPPSQARTVASHLTKATFVLFGSEGHIVMSKTPSCPGTITAQFLDNPAGELDTSCADAFRINFELP